MKKCQWKSNGSRGLSLADVMAAAGLTHGGFYRHFRNKEQLIAEALSAAGDKTIAVGTSGKRRQCCGRQLSVDVAPRFTEPDLPVRSPTFGQTSAILSMSYDVLYSTTGNADVPQHPVVKRFPSRYCRPCFALTAKPRPTSDDRGRDPAAPRREDGGARPLGDSIGLVRT
jgi:hypothetical protein